MGANISQSKKVKPTFVADILHNPVSLTWLEKRILGTAVFNRLHSVKQNSTAYLTFPTLNHVRFSHSLGCASIASKLFSFGIKNADETDKTKFLKALNACLSKIRLPALTYACLADKSNISFDTFVSGNIDALSGIMAHGEGIIHFRESDLGPTFLVVMQAVRIAALVHDLGHPPFSHVTEFALKEVYQHLDTLNSNLNDRQSRFMSSMNPGDKSLEPHELLTLNLFSFLTKKILQEIDKDNDSDFLTASWFSLKLAELILIEGECTGLNFSEDEGKLFKCLHGLISSDLDADRLDYIQRDSMLAGIRNDDLGLHRLIYLYQLKYVDNTLPCFLPNVRALRNLEEFFQARYTLYRNVIYHHHVVKTDAFLQEAVKDLIFDYLNNDTPAPVDQDTEYLDISWLWKVFENTDNSGASFLEKIYLRWDDHWLISLLRNRYIKLSGTSDGSKYSKLEELIASKRNYISLLKRIEDFALINNTIAEALRPKKDIPKLMQNLMEVNQKKVENKLEISQYANRLINVCSDEDLEFQNNLSIMREILMTLELLSYSYDAFLNAVKCDFIKNNNLEDCVLVQKHMSPGIKSSFKVVSGSDVLTFDNVSQLPGELKRRSENCPSLFSYVLPRSANSTLDRKSLMKSFGIEYANHFYKIIRDLAENKPNLRESL